MAERATPFLWFFFSVGGTITALLFPVHLLLTGLAFPLGWLEPPAYQAASDLVRHPATRIYLFVLIAPAFFHWAHRFRYAVNDALQLHAAGNLIAALCYGAAAVGTLVAAYTLLAVP